MKTYRFSTQLQQGLKAEQFIDRQVKPDFHIELANRSEQRRGIDRILTHWRSGKVWRVEYKTDHRAQTTGNAFVETISVDRDLKLGWAVTSESDLLLYYIPGLELIYVIRFEALRVQLPRWLRTLPIRSIQNQGYAPHGILVPLHEFEVLSEVILSC